MAPVCCSRVPDAHEQRSHLTLLDWGTVDAIGRAFHSRRPRRESRPVRFTWARDQRENDPQWQCSWSNFRPDVTPVADLIAIIQRLETNLDGQPVNARLARNGGVDAERWETKTASEVTFLTRVLDKGRQVDG
jgi:hypothetical protein